MKAVVPVVFTHEVNGIRKQETVSIEREADRKAYTADAFESHIRSILEQKGAVNPAIVSIGKPTPVIGEL
jgi:hypothetical protein